jgi:hypothetical protein
MRNGRRIEIVTVGSNPNLQLVGSDASGSAADLGLWIGSTNAGETSPSMRQTFILCTKRFNAHQKGRLVGFRQYLTIGTYLPAFDAPPVYPLERPVTTPTWKFTDGNVLWGIRKVFPETHFQPNLANADGLAFLFSQTPAQLFESFVGEAVVPPYGGYFLGNALTPELAQFSDLRGHRWDVVVPCDVEIVGPCDITFYASVKQTSPGGRLAIPGSPTFSTTSGATPEDAFVQTYENVSYFRVAGALIFEMEDYAPGGMPKTYRDPGGGDRITRDTTTTGDNEMRQSGSVTSDSGCDALPPADPGTQRRGRTQG